MLRVVHKSGKSGVPKRDTCHFTISSMRLEGLCAPVSSAPSHSPSFSLSIFLPFSGSIIAFLVGEQEGESLKMNSGYGGTEKTIALHVQLL